MLSGRVRSSGEGRHGRRGDVTALAATAAGAVGAAVELVAYDWEQVELWVPDLVVGWTFLAAAWTAWTSRGHPRAAALLAAVGVTWFLGLIPGLVFLHRGPLVHLLVTYPGWRPRAGVVRAAVVVGYVAAVLVPLWANDVAATALVLAVVAVTVHGALTARAGERGSRVVAVCASAGLAVLVVGGAAVRSASPSEETVLGILLAYDAGLCGLALGATALLPRPSRAELTDLAVELGEGGEEGFRDRLAHALGDPTLVVGYWSSDVQAYQDAAGQPIELPPPGTGRVTTPVDVVGARLAVVVHDKATPVQQYLSAAVETAVRLAAANQALRAQVERQVVEALAARRRLVEVADRERQALAERVRLGPVRHLDDVGGLLRTVGGDVGPQAAQHVTAAWQHLEGTRGDLRELAMGLHPRELTDEGLPRALLSLAARSPVAVLVDAVVPRLPVEVETAVYFVCAEAVTNALKHAHARRVDIRVRAEEDSVRVTVSDDGVGGAFMAGGSGLQGLVDRVAALDGRLRLTSVPGAGTCVAANLPIGGDGATRVG